MEIKLKNTKLQDENKKPIVFYHATPYRKKIDSFLPLSHFGTQLASQMRALHFIYQSLNIPEPTVLPTKFPTFLQRKKAPATTTYRTYLSIKNPLKIPDFSKHSLEQFYNWFSTSYTPKSKFLTGPERCEGDVVGPAKMKYKKHLSNFIFINPFTRSKEELKSELSAECLYSFKHPNNTPKQIPSFLHPVYSCINRDSFALAEKVSFQRMIRFLEGEGYDGFVYQNEYEDKGKNSYIIFRPQQVFIPEKHETSHTFILSNEAFLKKIENVFFISKETLSPSQRIQNNKRLRLLCLEKRQYE